MPTEEYYEHPELVEEEIFKHKVDLLELDATGDVSSGSKDEKREEETKKKKSEELEREREFNEVYPKERASKQGADSASSSPMVAGSPAIVLVCFLVMAIGGRV